MPAPHPPEFRQRAVELARQGTAPVAKAFQPRDAQPRRLRDHDSGCQTTAPDPTPEVSGERGQDQTREEGQSDGAVL
jgi:transposase-like protein